MICTVHVSSNRQLNTLITVHTETEIDQTKTVYILYATVLLQKKVLLNKEDFFGAAKKHFNLRRRKRSHIKLRVF